MEVLDMKKSLSSVASLCMPSNITTAKKHYKHCCHKYYGKQHNTHCHHNLFTFKLNNLFYLSEPLPERFV